MSEQVSTFSQAEQRAASSNAPLPLPLKLRVLRSLLGAELAAGIYGLKLFMACVSIATFVIGTVWIMGDGLSGALQRGGTMFLGGDAAVTVVNVPLDDAIQQEIATLGTMSRVAELRTSAVIGSDRIPVEVKGVDDIYPLYGAVRLESGQTLASALSADGDTPRVVVEPSLLQRASAQPGDRIRLGSQDFIIADTLMLEPDRLSAGRFMIGPRVLMALPDLERVGLIQRGSLVDYRYRLRLDDVDAETALDRLASLRPDAGWELETPSDAGDRVRRTVERTTTFLGMAGIAALAIGLAGAWAAAKAWISRRTRTIALYRLSGATPETVLALHAVIVAIASLAGMAIGLAVSTALVLPVMDLIAGALHLIWTAGNVIRPLVEVGIILGIGILGTSFLALSAANRIAPGAAMRSGEADPEPEPRHAAIGIALIAAAMIAATLSLPIPAIAGVAVAGLAGAVAVLALAAAGLARVAPLMTPVGFVGVVICQGLSKVGPVATRAVAIGVGIAGITAIVAAQSSLETALRAELPERIPDLVLIDVQPDQVDDIRGRIDENPALGGLQANPFMRMTITAVNGVPAEEALVRPDKSWVIEGDRSFSWSAEPTGAELLAGEWWDSDYAGPPVLSPEEDLQEAFDLKPGDTMTYSVLGRSFTSEVVNIRKEYHRTFRPEYLLMASPEPFRSAPQSWVMSLQGENDAAVSGLMRDLASNHPNVTSIDIRQIVTQVTEVVDGAVLASLMVALILVIAGGLSLAAVIAADVDSRRREALVFTLIGASRREIATARLLEAVYVGAIAALIGGAAGLLGGYWAVAGALRVDWSPGIWAFLLPFILGATASAAAGLMGGLGAVPRGRGQMVRQLTS